MAYTTVAKPSDHFDCPTWDGSDSTTTVTGMGFKPDSLWIKRYDGSGDSILNNSTLGVAKNWDTTNYSGATDTTTYVASYTSDGFTLTGNINATNDASQIYYSACWKANGGTTASNSDGSITSTVQANTTSGFSLVKWTGTGATGTIGHGLGVAPKIIIAKNMSAANTGATLNMSNMFVTDPETDFMEFASNTSQLGDGADRWNDTAPTTSVFSVGNTSQINGSSGECMAYCFAEVQGFSKFGYYTGNGNTKGPTIYCGFRPKWIMVKNISATEDWAVKVSGLTGYGLGGQRTRTIKLGADDSATNATVNFESTGFRPTTTDGKVNGDGVQYFYMAFAEMPTVGTNGTIALAT